jgi:hypothetical protein
LFDTSTKVVLVVGETGTSQFTCVEETKTADGDRRVEPNLQARASVLTKFAPNTVTKDPPSDARAPVGRTDVTSSALRKLKEAAEEEVKSPPEFIETETDTVSSAWGGEEQVARVDEITIPVVSMPPNRQTASALRTKFVPVTVTSVPPLTGPLAGEMEATVGAGT